MHCRYRRRCKAPNRAHPSTPVHKNGQVRSEPQTDDASGWTNPGNEPRTKCPRCTGTRMPSILPRPVHGLVERYAANRACHRTRLGVPYNWIPERIRLGERENASERFHLHSSRYGALRRVLPERIWRRSQFRLDRGGQPWRQCRSECAPGSGRQRERQGPWRDHGPHRSRLGRSRGRGAHPPGPRSGGGCPGRSSRHDGVDVDGLEGLRPRFAGLAWPGGPTSTRRTGTGGRP